MGFWDFIKPKPKPKRVDLYCVPQSIGNAWAFGALRKVPVRIAVYKVKKGTDHSQAEAKIDEQWTPLTLNWDNGPVVEKWEKHYPDLEPYRYLTLREWIDEQIIFVGNPLAEVQAND